MGTITKIRKNLPKNSYMAASTMLPIFTPSCSSSLLCIQKLIFPSQSNKMRRCLKHTRLSLVAFLMHSYSEASAVSFPVHSYYSILHVYMQSSAYKYAFSIILSYSASANSATWLHLYSSIMADTSSLTLWHCT